MMIELTLEDLVKTPLALPKERPTAGRYYVVVHDVGPKEWDRWGSYHHVHTRVSNGDLKDYPVKFKISSNSQLQDRTTLWRQFKSLTGWPSRDPVGKELIVEGVDLYKSPGGRWVHPADDNQQFQWTDEGRPYVFRVDKLKSTEGKK